MTEDLRKRPKLANSQAQIELDKAEEQFEAFDKNIKSMTMDRMNLAPKEEVEPQTKLSQQDIANSKEIYLKPKRSIPCREKFNEDYRQQWNYDKEYVNYIVENKEIIGESLDFWTKPYAGIPAEEWVVPANTPVWFPRYVLEQLGRKGYHRMHMEDRATGSGAEGQYYGQMAVDKYVERISVSPVIKRRSLSMGKRF